MNKKLRKIFSFLIAVIFLLNPVIFGIAVNAQTAVDVNIKVEGITEEKLSLSDFGVVSEEGSPTALDALEQALDSEDIDYELAVFDWGVMIVSIDGEAGGAFGGWDGWMYRVVRGEETISPWVGANEFELETGDEVIFYYSRWATISTESAMEYDSESPEVTVSVVGDDFSDVVVNPATWEIDPGTTGLVVASVTIDESQQATISFTGTAGAGTISIKAKAEALGGESESNEISLKTIELGDVNADGLINISDAILILRHIVNLNLLSDIEINRADVNRDGMISIRDAILVLRYIVKNIEDFPNESSSELIENAITKTIFWYNQNNSAPESWEGLAALWGSGEDLNGEPWAPNQDWRLNDPGFDADDDGNSHPQYIFRLLSVGINPANVWEGRNLLAELASQQSENGLIGNLGKHIWSMVALEVGSEIGLDTGSWSTASRENAVDYLLSQQNQNGSFGPFSELDFTGWALTALSVYMDNPDVAEAIADAVNFLKSKQQNNAGFAMEGEWGAENSNSNASVISGLVAVGEDLLNIDGDWVKNGNTVIKALLKYQQEDGSFWYMEDSAGSVLLSTTQCLMALVDLKNAESTRYRMGQEINFPD